MAYRKLGDVAVGTTLYLNENSSPVPYLVVHQGIPSSMYDASCNGTWLLRKDLYSKAPWDTENSNVLPGADIFTTMANMMTLYDEAIQGVIKTVKIPYCIGGNSSTVRSGTNGLSCNIFPLSGYEMGWTTNDYHAFPVDGSKLSYFISGTGSSANNKRLATLNGGGTLWWSRSPRTDTPVSTWSVAISGGYDPNSPIESLGIRPAMVMPVYLIVDDDGNILPAPPTPVLTAPSNAMQGQPIPVSWTASEMADSYTLQRKIDAGEWETIYTGLNLQYQETAGSWSTVQYRVAASMEGVFSDYAQSAVIPVVSASALVISGQNGDLGTLVNDVPYTVSTDTGNQITVKTTVNGAVILDGTVPSGTAEHIPVLDLVNGDGTIVIEASVQTASGTVSAMRTWTYDKAAITFPSSGSVAQLQKNGNTIWPKTLAECVRIPGGKTLDQVMGFPAQIFVSQYTGTGTYGSGNPNELTIPFKPLAVFVTSGSNGTTIPMVRPGLKAMNGSAELTVAWEDAGVSWYSTSAANQLNVSGTTYDVVALG